MKLIEVFLKQGGTALLTQYWKSGAFFTAVAEFFLLGKSRTALEILRLSANLKVKQKLEKKYRGKLEEFDRRYNNAFEHVNSKRVWVCWLQGLDEAPEIVRICFDSLQKNILDREVLLITEENYQNYVSFPEIIQQKINNGIIKGAHMTDLLRLELLIKYGGTWIDATVLCTSPNIPNYMLDADLFMFQCLKPGRDGHSKVCSNWLITASSNNRLLSLTRDLLYEYWFHNDSLVDYFIFHFFFQMCIDAHPEEWNKVVPFSNATPHILLLRLFDVYNADIWEAIKQQTPFHKLTYKFCDEQKNADNTYYQHLILISKKETIE